jgi:ABC-2 type transport system ATP-binding protein
MNEFISSSSEHWVLVRSPQLSELTTALEAAGATVKPGIEDSIQVAGLDSRAIGDLASTHKLTLHELATQQGSLEEAFMDLTHDSVEYRASVEAA